uniref:Trehalase n=1 Tax=Caenorhabditis japonica TaxID=281687 RepID=A0A8R1I020_CAEJA
VLWNEEHGCWFDYDLEEHAHAICFHDTNFFPMYTGAYHADLDAQRVADYLVSTGATGFPGGVPVSLTNTGEQWDFPNCWPPTTYVLCEGLR